MAFYVGRHLRDGYFLAYSVLTTLMQLFLLDAIVSARRKKYSSRGGPISWKVHHHGESPQSVLAAAVRKAVWAFASGDAARGRTLVAALCTSFWGWDELKPYVEVLIVFITTVLAFSFFLARYDAYNVALGFLGALAEALVGIPQIRENYRRRGTDGLSPLMMIFWLGGDALKYAYYKNAALRTFTRLTLAQIACDATLLAQIAIYSAPCQGCLAGCDASAAVSNNGDVGSLERTPATATFPQEPLSSTARFHCQTTPRPAQEAAAKAPLFGYLSRWVRDLSAKVPMSKKKSCGDIRTISK